LNFLSAFVASFGSMLLMAALIASWLFRSSAAPLIAKIAIPAVIVALACITPYQVNGMLGFPFFTPLGTLPARVELIAFVAQNDDTRVDLWLRQGNASPRAYQTVLDNKLKQTLREAQDRLSHGRRVMMVKSHFETKRAGTAGQTASENLGYELDDSVFSLPPKG
jgi:hypothetical protein